VGRDGKFRPEVVPGGGGASAVVPIDDAEFAIGDHAELARRLVRRLRDGTESLLHAEGRFHRYDAATGVYEEVPRRRVTVEVTRFSGLPMAGTKRVMRISDSDVRGAARIASDLVLHETDDADFAHQPRGLACRNGFATLDGSEIRLLSHSPGNLARHRVDYDFDPAAPHPRLDQFFADVFADATDGDETRRVSLLQEFVGACLVGDAPFYQQCLVLWGREGGNGKSQFLEIARSVFPPSALSSLPPQVWGERFTRVELVGKLANLVGEIPSRDVSATDVFKTIVDGEPVKVEDKHERPYVARMTAGHVFNANRMPTSSDVTPAFFRRFLVCPFECDMRGSDKYVKDLGREIANAEGPGILAWALEGARRRRAARAYTESSKGRFVLRTWRSDYDPLMYFLRKVAPGTDWESTQLHHYCVENGLTTKNAVSFGRFMADLSDESDPGRMFDRRRSDGTWYRRRDSG
jgi:putative DNA primase/helicase